MIELISGKIVTRIKNADPDIKTSHEVLNYALILLIGKYMIISGIIIVGIITGSLFNSIVSYMSFAALRKYTGGKHMSSMSLCVVVSITILSLAPHIHFNDYTGIVINVISLILVLVYAPSNIPFDPFTSKLFGSVLIGLNIFANYDVVTFNFFIQAITLIKIRR